MVRRIGQSMIPVAEKLGGTMLRQQSYQVENGDGEIDSQIETIMTRNHVDVPVDTDLSSTNIEDILDVVTKGYVKNCGPLNALCQEANFYQLWSREYVKHLGDYLLERTAARRSVDTQQQAHTNDIEEGMPMISQDTVILDIGAGDGVLMHCLRDYMERKVMGVPDNRKSNSKKRIPKTGGVIPTMVAIDDMSWRIFTKGPVEKLSAEQALDKYSTTLITQTTPDNATDSTSSLSSDQQDRGPQVIVLCSWMPMGEDWTALFRKEGVDEYILIGEADDGSVGDNWLTWGNPAFYAKNDDADDAETEVNNDEDGISPTPPYVTDRYHRWDMDDLTKFQFSSFDLAVSKSSKTVSFRKSL